MGGEKGQRRKEKKRGEWKGERERERRERRKVPVQHRKEQTGIQGWEVGGKVSLGLGILW